MLSIGLPQPQTTVNDDYTDQFCARSVLWFQACSHLCGHIPWLSDQTYCCTPQNEVGQGQACHWWYITAKAEKISVMLNSCLRLDVIDWNTYNITLKYKLATSSKVLCVRREIMTEASFDDNDESSCNYLAKGLIKFPKNSTEFMI